MFAYIAVQTVQTDDPEQTEASGKGGGGEVSLP